MTGISRIGDAEDLHSSPVDDPAAPYLLLVEDDLVLAANLARTLEQVGYRVDVAPDAAAAAVALERRTPDLALLDVRLGRGPDGFEVARRVRARTDSPIIFVTAVDALANRLEGFEVGADDYLVKPFALSELLARVRAVLRRSGRSAATSIEVRDLVIDERLGTVTVGGEIATLTQTEFELLLTLARNAGEVLSKTQLLSLVWGYEHYDTNLVEVHVSALRRKIERNHGGLIQTRRGRGYVLMP